MCSKPSTVEVDEAPESQENEAPMEDGEPEQAKEGEPKERMETEDLSRWSVAFHGDSTVLSTQASEVYLNEKLF